MATTSRPGRINIDLGPYKQAWMEYCARHRVKPNDAFRRIVAKLISEGPDAVGDAVEDAEGTKVRKEIRLTRKEVALAATIAAREGYSLSRWLTAVILVRLGAGYQLGQHELEALGRSNLLLLAIGRNLNQVARALHVSGVTPQRLPEAKIVELHEQIVQHTATVAAVLSRNIERWRSI